jgi:predicted metal-dependent hydrolase
MDPTKNPMDQSTWRIIDGLRNISKQMDAVLRRDLIDAAARLQEQAELIEKMRAEMVNPDDLSQQMLKLVAGMNEAKAAQVRPEPSRLEIAAMIMAGGVTGEYGMQALVYADMLIAAAKKPMKFNL